MIKRMLAALLAFLAMSVFAAVDVNKASSAELDAVKGIGPAIATKITTERAKGPFKDWQDLIGRVSGIGEKSAAKLSENGLTVNGATFGGAAPAAVVAKPAAKPAVAPAAPAPTTAATPAATTGPTAKAAASADAKAAAKAEAVAKKKADAQAKAASRAEAKSKTTAKDVATAASAAKK